MGLYSAPNAPAAPDPKVTAAAQTGTNVATALANANLQNVNQVTPDGSLTYSQNGTYEFRDPTNGAVYKLPQYTATTSLSAGQQAIKDQNDAASLNLATTANKASGFLTDYLGKGADTSSIPGVQYGVGKGPGMQTSIGNTAGKIQYGFGDAGQIQTGFADAGDITKTYNSDFSADRDKVESAMFSRTQPQIDRDRASLETSLANQGVRIGSTAYASAMDDFNRGVSDQRTSILLGAGQEQSRLVGLEAQRAQFQNAAQGQNYDQLAGRAAFSNAAQQQNFGQLATRAEFNNAAQNQDYQQMANNAAFKNSAQQQWYGQAANNVQMNNAARQQSIGEAYAARNQPINEITALMNGSQVQNPSFINTPSTQIPTVDYAGLVNQNYQNQMSAYQAQQAQRQSTLGGLFGLGASIIGMSDRRLKTDVETVGTGPLGLPIYAFRYVWGGPRQVGFMAQDVLRVLPSAVLRMANGFLAVDYGKVFAKGAA